MKPLPLLAGALAAVALATLAARDAQACWDGYAASVARVTLRVPGDPEWKPETARTIARWATRMNAILPAGTQLESDCGTVTVCTTGADGACGATVAETTWDNGSLAALFSKLAAATRATPAAVQEALRLDAHPLTLQVWASRTQSGADAIAKRINDTHEERDGFYTAGGFPSSNPSAHVVDGTDAHGERVYRVVVGAFLTRAEAAAAGSELRSAMGMDCFVRPL